MPELRSTANVSNSPFHAKLYGIHVSYIFQEEMKTFSFLGAS